MDISWRNKNEKPDGNGMVVIHYAKRDHLPEKVRVMWAKTFLRYFDEIMESADGWAKAF